MKTTKDLKVTKKTTGFFKKKTVGYTITTTVAEAVGGAVLIGTAVTYTGYRCIRGAFNGIKNGFKKKSAVTLKDPTIQPLPMEYLDS